MKRILVFAWLVWSVSGWGETNHSFGLYLTAEPVDNRFLWYGKGDCSKIRLQERPVIRAADIVSYNWTNYALVLRPGVRDRLPHPGVPGIPFVVVADGERVYLGAFVTGLSSASFAVPCIRLDRPFAPVSPLPEDADTLRIERAYPGPSFGQGPDPRPDPRIKAALQALDKLAKEPSAAKK